MLNKNNVLVFIDSIENIRIFCRGELVGSISAGLPNQTNDILEFIKKMLNICFEDDYELYILEYSDFANNYTEVKIIEDWFTFRTYIHQEDLEVIFNNCRKFCSDLVNKKNK